MDCSLFSRLYGCCLGLVISESLARQTLPHQRSNQFIGSALPLTWMAALIEAGRWDDAACPLGLLELDDGTLSGAEFAIATLPIALYFHHDLRLQRHYLWRLAHQLKVAPDQGNQVMVFAYVLAQALRGQLVPETLVPQVLAYLKVVGDDPANYPAPSHAVVNQLNQLKLLLAHPYELAIAIAELQQYAADPTLALALYAFLGSPAHWHLTLNRVLALSETTSPFVLLVGLLSGADNGSFAIPAHLHTHLNGVHCLAEPNPLSAQRLQHLVAQFLALWSGVCGVPNRSLAALMPLSVVAPGTLRSSAF